MTTSARKKAPLCKGGWQKSLIFDWGIVPCQTAIPPASLTLGHPQAPFVCFADIFPANGEIYPLHKGGFTGHPVAAHYILPSSTP